MSRLYIDKRGPSGQDPVAISARPIGRNGVAGQWCVRVGDVEHTVAARRLSDGRMAITPLDAAGQPIPGAGFLASVSKDREGAWVSVGAKTARIAEVLPGAAGHEGDSGGLEAPMPGKVLDVLVVAGDAVTQGQTLIVVEAMKMEHAIKSPADGVVAKVSCVVGAQVSPGQPLVVLRDAGDPEAGEAETGEAETGDFEAGGDAG